MSLPGCLNREEHLAAQHFVDLGPVVREEIGVECVTLVLSDDPERLEGSQPRGLVGAEDIGERHLELRSFGTARVDRAPDQTVTGEEERSGHLVGALGTAKLGEVHGQLVVTQNGTHELPEGSTGQASNEM